MNHDLSIHISIMKGSSDLRQRVQKCFVEHEMNNLSLYKNVVDKGFIQVKDSMEYTVSISAKDFEGNKTRLIVPIQGKKDSIIIPKVIEKTDGILIISNRIEIKDSLITVYFPKKLFMKISISIIHNKNGIVKLHNSQFPVHKSFKLSFDVSNILRRNSSIAYR